MLLIVLEIFIDPVMKKIITEAQMAFSKNGKAYKLVSFAGSKLQAERMAEAYQEAGYKTEIKKATPAGFALYAEWL